MNCKHCRLTIVIDESWFYTGQTVVSARELIDGAGSLCINEEETEAQPFEIRADVLLGVDSKRRL